MTLTGPAGVGKTTTLRILAQELDLEILEWKTSMNESTGSTSSRKLITFKPCLFLRTSFVYKAYELNDPDLFSEGHFTRFEAFLSRSLTCNSLFSSSSSSQQSSKRRIVLLEDLPNVLHDKTQEKFHDALRSFVNMSIADSAVPLIIVISDAGLRGEDRDTRIGEGNFGRDKGQVIDVRTVIPRDLLSTAYVTEIKSVDSFTLKSLLLNYITSFNPIAPTLLRKALQAMLNKHFAQNSGGMALSPSKEVLDAIVESSNGDIRSAIMALQFACIVEIPSRKQKNKATKMVMEAVTRREQTLAMFHLLGKVLYNKRQFS